jgi:aminopeptidase
MDLENSLEKYAELIVHTGLNLQAGEKLMIRANAEGLELVRKVAKAAYQAGVVDVKLLFQDDQLSLTRYLHAPDSAFETYPEYEVEYTEALYKDGYQILVLSGVDPELLKTADPKRISTFQKTAGIATKRIQHYTMENKNKWCVVGAATNGWAKSAFPDLPAEEAKARLWQNIFKATRVDQEDPVAAWQAHDEELKRHMDFLNEAKFEKIVFEGPGTDLVVGLAEGNRWDGGSGKSQAGVSFFPNMPTEEIFSMPHADKVNGKITATLPLSLRGQLVDKFWFKFEDGKVTDFDAAQGKEILQGLLDTDEGARRLGEIALVAHHSPISQTGVLFKNTLFDENASCHLALGQAYSDTMQGATGRTEEENRKLGMNDSMIHTDFMVGSDQVTVTGIRRDGSQVVLLKDGDWQI